MTTRAQSTGKEEPQYPDNEDAFRLATEQGFWAVADGAGGGGIYAAEWARYLTDHVPGQPMADFPAFAAWTDGIWEPFYEQYRSQAATDALKTQKFMTEGSYATLATLHLTGQQAIGTTYGDAVVVVWHPTTGLRSSAANLSLFATPPFLLNWKDASQPEGFGSDYWPHQPGQCYALLTDTLAQYVLMAYAALTGSGDELRELAQYPTALGERAATHLNHWQSDTYCFADDVWKPLTDTLHTRADFLAYARSLAARNLLGPDDYTMVLILEDAN